MRYLYIYIFFIEAVCEKCGAIGVKHAFYTRERRFCSMACARGYNGLTPEPLTPQQQNADSTTSTTPTPTATLTPTPGQMPTLTPAPTLALNATPTTTPINTKQYGEYKFKMELEDEFSSSVSDEPLPQISAPPPVISEDLLPHPRRKNAELANTHDWDHQLNERGFFAAPVSCFRHAPITEMWDNILVGMKVEVENTDCDDFSDAFHDSFWVATVLKITGYKALMRYEGFGTNGTKDFWVSLCSAQVHPVGWCATRGKPLIPPKTIEDKYNDWKEFLVKRLTGARTLPSNFSNKIADSLKCRFQCGLNLEVVDKNRISQVKVAMVHKIIGKRLHVRYYDSPPDDNGFWCHEDSPLIHPVGWAKKVGHTLDAPPDYLERINEGIWDEDDATDDLFLASQTGTSSSDLNPNANSRCSGFCEGMKLEAIDPLNLSSICVATVMDVLRFGYIMIRIDSYDADATGADWFCYHISSPCIFPAGFCASNSIPLTPPKGYEVATFQWDTYLRDTNNIAASVHLFNRDMPNHGFVAGMKMEAADLMDPRLVCVATVAKVVGRLLKIRFDGWEEEYDQWLDCESPDIYPVGWCQLVGHKLEGPRVIPKQQAPIVKSPKGLKKRGRKKKKDLPIGNGHDNSHANGIGKEKVAIKQEMFVNIDAVPVIKQEIDIVEPEMGQEPSGPDQSMPVAAEPTPPLERKATSYINVGFCFSKTNKH